MPFSLFKPKKPKPAPSGVKAESERIIKQLGGRVCDWLPVKEHTELRPSTEVADRALVLHAMGQIPFHAPTAVLAAWIRANSLEASLTMKERTLLACPNNQLIQQELSDLFWYFDALWAMVWAGGLIQSLAIDQPMGDTLAALLPDLQKNEPATSFRAHFTLRPADEIYAMLDLYYRAHWYAVEAKLKGYSTRHFELDSIIERRRALEWISDRTIPDWEQTPQDT